MNRRRIPSALILSSLLLAAPAALQAAGGFVLGEPVSGQDIGECNTTAPVFTTPDEEGANLFLLRSDPGTGAPLISDMLWNFYGESEARICTYAEDPSSASWNCSNAGFAALPGPIDRTWAAATLFADHDGDGSPDLTTHDGWFMFDNSPGPDDSSRPQVIQRLRQPTVSAATGLGGSPGDPISGFDLVFEYPIEFETDPGATVDICFAGGDAAFTGFDSRFWLGFNVYRLNTADVDPATSTPEHYLCGPDLDCSPGASADNGWIGFIPLDPSSAAGLSVDDPTATTLDPAYPAGVEERASGPGSGTPLVDIVYSDRPTDMLQEYSYVVQPVARVNSTGNPFTDWNGMLALDLDDDGVPEFVDPSGQGLGLTANGGSIPSAPLIFISAEAVANGATTTPVTGSLELDGYLDARSGGVTLSFLSNLEGNVAGFNVYRSVDGQSFVRVNDRMIAAKGIPLARYSYEDHVNVRRLRTRTLFYKVEAMTVDGGRTTLGPYQVAVPATETRQRRLR